MNIGQSSLLELDDLWTSVVFPMNEVNGWKQALPKDFKTPMEYYLELTSGEKKCKMCLDLDIFAFDGRRQYAINTKRTNVRFK